MVACVPSPLQLLEQMEWIANVELPDGETLCVEDQITSLGLEIARNEVGA